MKKWMLFVVLLLVLPTLACSFSLDMGGETREATTPEPPTEEAAEPSPTPLPTQEPPTPVPPTPTPILFEDDFSDSGSGWEVGDYGTGSLGYRDGAYAVSSIGDEQVMWGLANQSFSDHIIDVDATQVSGPSNDNNAYGVMCRVQPNGIDGYMLRISGDGFCSIHKVMDGNAEALVDWTTSEAIRQGNATNHLRVVCDGADLALFVNGELVADATDTSFVEGDIALTATTYEDESTEVLFDNVLVTRPAP